jgi:hypothetical protein
VIGTQAPVAVVITGFDPTWNINFLFGKTNPNMMGSSYILFGDRISYFINPGINGIPAHDLYIQFNGMFNCLTPDETTTALEFPVEGGWGVATGSEGSTGYNDIDLYSSFNFDDNMDDVWIESAPDWVVSYDYDDSYFADNNVIALFFKADALPAGVTGRSGNIVISSYGVSASIPVTQGNATGIFSPNPIELTKVIHHGDNFVLEYPASTGLVSIYNTAGQKIANYLLPSFGTFSIPDGNYPQGVYLFCFTGAKGAYTVKAIK